MARQRSGNLFLAFGVTVSLSAHILAQSLSTPESTGLGASKQTALEVCRGNAQTYISWLRCPDGSLPSPVGTQAVGNRTEAPKDIKEWERELLSARATNVIPYRTGDTDYHLVDAYHFTCGAEKKTLYVDAFHCDQRLTKEAPSGFALQIPKLRASPAVLQLVEAYLASPPVLEAPSRERDYAGEDYLNSFFSGFTSPGGKMFGGNQAGRDGYDAGQKYHMANPDKFQETMEGFGFSVTTVTGIFTSGFETSHFVPDGQPKERWWLSGLANTKSDLPKQDRTIGMRTASKPVHIRITGFLSPPGRYGHMSMYNRQFFATTISQVTGNE